MPFGLSEDVVARIADVFAAYPQIDEVILYGSRAKGNPKQGSDIDLSLKGRGLDLKVLNQISLKIDDLYLPYQVDLNLFFQIDNSSLVDHITRVGKTLYKKKTN